MAIIRNHSCSQNLPRLLMNQNEVQLLRSKPSRVCVAGNSSTENDGAAACMIISGEIAKGLRLKPMIHIKVFAVTGADPDRTYFTVPRARKEWFGHPSHFRKYIDA